MAVAGSDDNTAHTADQTHSAALRRITPGEYCSVIILGVGSERVKALWFNSRFATFSHFPT
jgi:hypothetical protein